MMMPMDDEVAKPETYGLAKNWTGATQGMMTLVRVLPPDRYDDIMRRVERRSARRNEVSRPAGAHSIEPPGRGERDGDGALPSRCLAGWSGGSW
jgi:hypothetical protein